MSLSSQIKTFAQNQKVRWAVRLAVTVGLLVLLFTRVDFRRVFDSLAGFDPRLIPLVLFVYFLIRYLLAVQMSMGLTPLGLRISTYNLFRAAQIAIFYSLVVPGDVVASGVSWCRLSDYGGKPIEAGALLVFFRIVNTLILLAIGSVAVWCDTRIGSMIFPLTVVGMFLVSCAVTLPFLSARTARSIETIVQSTFKNVPFSKRVGAKLRHCWSAITAFRQTGMRSLLWIVLISLITHLLGIMNYYLLAAAIGMDISLFTIGWIRTLIVILQMLPISVGGLGVREASLVVLLGQYGVLGPQALSYSLAVFTLNVAGGLIGGLLEGQGLLTRRRAVASSRRLSTHEEQ